MFEVYRSNNAGFPGQYCGYVSSDGSVFSDGFHFQSGNFVGYVRNDGNIYLGGSETIDGKYVGSVRWHAFECKIYKSDSSLEENEILVGWVTPDGNLYADGYHLPDTAKYKGYIKNFSWNQQAGQAGGAAALLLLSE